MPIHVALTFQDEKQMEGGGGLAPQTIKDKEREAKAFYDFMESKNKIVEDLLKTEEGRKTFTELFSKYFFSMRVRDGTTRPNEGYASKLKSAIKTSIIEDFCVNIFDFTLFPDMDQKWRAFIDELGEEGLCFTEHREEVPPKSLDKMQIVCELLQPAVCKISKLC